MMMGFPDHMTEEELRGHIPKTFLPMIEHVRVTRACIQDLPEDNRLLKTIKCAHASVTRSFINGFHVRLLTVLAASAADN